MGEQALALARENLLKVIKALEAQQMNNTPVVRIKVGKHYFEVQPGAVHSLNKDGIRVFSTCIQSSGIPTDEMVATMLLLLKNDPYIFERWRGDHGTLYGA